MDKMNDWRMDKTLKSGNTDIVASRAGKHKLWCVGTLLLF